MLKTGVAKLPLHRGRAPRWLTKRMVKLADKIVTVLVEEYGQDEFLRRVSDPYWFQSLGCVLGYDWHSSGVTTVLTGVLKRVVNPETHGLAVCGGKGRASRKTPTEICDTGSTLGLSTSEIQRLVYSSKMAAKVDNTAIQTGHPLYHHAFFLSDRGCWAVVQQGMNTEDKTARRYHWLSNTLKEDFVNEPHQGIVGDVENDVAFDMTAGVSGECRETSVEISREESKRVKRLLDSVRPKYQRSLEEWTRKSTDDYTISILSMPRRINWNALREAYEFQPKNYEELLSIKGVGPATIRGLALISEVIYGKGPSWKDPVKFSFAFGGKDGVPRPVDKEAMDTSIQILEDAIQASKIGINAKLKSLERLRRFVYKR